MDKNEKILLKVVALSSIVIAVASFGSMVIQMRESFDTFLLPKWTIQIIITILALLGLYYTIYSIYLYYAK